MTKTKDSPSVKTDGKPLDNSFPSRSQAIRHLVEDHLVEKKWKCDNEVAGAITLVYPHKLKDIRSRTASFQHEFRDVIMAIQKF